MQKRQVIVYAFLVFLVLSLLVFFLFKLPIFSSVSSFTQTIFSPITSSVHSIFKLGTSTNLLKEEDLSLSQKLVDQSKLAADNKALRDQFQTQNIKSTSLVEANIVGSPSFIPGITLPENFILDKGSNDNLKVGQPVIYKDNLVGVISQTSGNFSKVTLLTNVSFSTTAQTLSVSAMGVAKGQGGGEIILDNVLLSQSLKTGDLVVTKGDLDVSGQGIPANLVLGKIVSVNKTPSSLFQIAKIKTLLDFASLSQVFVVKN